jgi:hypothetical protein
MSEWKRKYVNAKPRKLQKIAFVMYMTIIINFQQSFWQKSTQITLPVVFLVYMYLIGLSPVFRKYRGLENPRDSGFSPRPKYRGL